MQVTTGPNNSVRATLDDAVFELRPEGHVVIFSDTLTPNEVKKKFVAAADVAALAGSVEIGADFVASNGATVEFAAGRFTVRTSGEVEIRPADEQNDPAVGQKMQDGTFYAGLTADGKYHIYAMAKDLRVRGSFNKLAEAVKELNADSKANLGYDDWKIGSLKDVQTVRKNLAEGVLRRSFKKSFHPDRYNPQRLLSKRAHIAVTSTADKLYPSNVANVRITEGSSYTVEQRTRMKTRALKLRLKRAFDKQHFYPEVNYAKNNLKAGAVNFASKDSGNFSCRPIRLLPV